MLFHTYTKPSVWPDLGQGGGEKIPSTHAEQHTRGAWDSSPLTGALLLSDPLPKEVGKDDSF